MNRQSDSPKENPDYKEILKELVGVFDQLQQAASSQQDIIACSSAQLLQHTSNISLQDIANVYKSGSSTDQQKTKNRLLLQRLNELIEMIPPRNKALWSRVLSFLHHDIAHLGFGELVQHAKQVCYEFVNYEGENDPEMMPLHRGMQDFYQTALRTVDDWANLFALPYGSVKAVAELQAGTQVSDLRDIDLDRMLRNIAQHLQIRFQQLDFSITSPSDRSRDCSQIVLDIEPTSLRASDGMVFCLLLNLLKNPARELLDVHGPENDLVERLRNPEWRPSIPTTIYVEVSELVKQNITMINIADSGNGYSIDEALQAMRELLRNDLLCETTISQDVKNILNKWKTFPHALSQLTMNSALDVFSIARTSGFGTREKLRGIGETPSGMGLWGATYLVEQLGGRILMTNLCEGGALCTIILPNNYLETSFLNRLFVGRKTAGTARAIRKCILNPFAASI